MMTISISIIGHNERGTLKKCLESVKWADEIVFVDCSSTDGSAEIAGEYTDKIFSRENNPNLNVNKQFGIDQCGSDWIMYLDPDEVVTEDLKAEIVSSIADPANDASGFSMPRKNFYFGKWLRHGGKYPDYQLRLFQKGKARFPCMNVHEKIAVDGKISRLKSPLLHFPCQTISAVTEKSEFYTSRKAEYFLRQGKNIKSCFWRPACKFIRNFLFKFGFLDGPKGAVACLMDAYNEMIFILKLKELRRGRIP